MSKEIFEKDEDILVLDIPNEERFLNSTSYDYSVEFIVSMMQGETAKIILEVPFQRQYVWKDDKASQLIESIIMNVPIPPLYFAEEGDSRWLVIDGLQRLNSLLRFFQNEFPLKKLEILKDLEKMKFKDLPPKAKSMLANGLLRVNVIKKDSHPDIKYDIFMRLNKGAVTLNYQELRNCLYRGRINDLAKEIVEDNHQLMGIFGMKEPHNRFLDVEFVIRFFALYENLIVNDSGQYEIRDYKGRMVTYLNHYMNATRDLPIDKVKQLKNIFNSAISRSVAVFGVERAFKDISAGKTKVNRALADCILLSFTKYETDLLVAKSDLINDLLLDLLSNNEAFKNSISQRTSDREILNYRINTWIKTIEDAF